MKFQILITFLIAEIIQSCLVSGQQQKNNEAPLLPCRLKKIILFEPAAGTSVSKEESNDLLSFKNVLRVSGIAFSSVSTDKMRGINLRNYDILILPHAAAKTLTPEMVLQITGAVKEGSGILFDGNSAMNETFAVPLLQLSQNVETVHDFFFYNATLYWNDSLEAYGVDTMAAKYTVVAADDSTHVPVIITGTSGKGKFISFANLFDAYTDKGYSTYPYLIELFSRVFGNITLARRLGTEMYFDPGMHPFPLKYDEIANGWHQHMIKKIYAAGWYFDDGNIDYEKLLRACHAYGIQVYCWLELPMVSIKFWNAHPEWREKTAELKDAQVDWRYLMNLADSACRKQVLGIIGQMLNHFDWDGVDLAELYYETVDDNRQHPDIFTPMNETVREDFKRKSGFDPYLLFDPSSTHYWQNNETDWGSYMDYRRTMISNLKNEFVGFIADISNHKNNFEPMLTVIDVTMVPPMTDYIGEDLQNTLALYRKYPITLQIEDPANCWGLTPERYDKLGRYYREFVKDKNRLVFDCNIVVSHEKGDGGFPCEKPSGEEIRQITYNMSIWGSRPAFYAEDATDSGDFNNISLVLARETQIRALNDSTWSIHAPSTVFVHTGLTKQRLYLDHALWKAADGDQVIVPAGEHLLGFSTIKENDAAGRLMFISGELLSARFSDKVIVFSYQEYKTGCYIIVSKKPSVLFIDSKPFPAEILENSSHAYAIKLPGNKHTVRMVIR